MRYNMPVMNPIVNSHISRNITVSTHFRCREGPAALPEIFGVTLATDAVEGSIHLGAV